MIIILEYSAIKMSAKVPLLYSVLKPDTSSDSPSAKSKGVRFVSARIVVNQIIKRMGDISKGQDFCKIKEESVRVKEEIRILNRISVILTS